MPELDKAEEIGELEQRTLGDVEKKQKTLMKVVKDLQKKLADTEKMLEEQPRP